MARPLSLAVMPIGDKKGFKGKAIVDHKQFILCVVAGDSQVHLISIHMS